MWKKKIFPSFRSSVNPFGVRWTCVRALHFTLFSKQFTQRKQTHSVEGGGGFPQKYIHQEILQIYKFSSKTSLEINTFLAEYISKWKHILIFQQNKSQNIAFVNTFAHLKSSGWFARGRVKWPMNHDPRVRREVFRCDEYSGTPLKRTPLKTETLLKRTKSSGPLMLQLNYKRKNPDKNSAALARPLGR